MNNTKRILLLSARFKLMINDIMKVVLTLRVTAVSLILLPDMTELSAAEEI